MPDMRIDPARASLVTLVSMLRQQLDAGATTLELTVADPDRGAGRYAGQPVAVGGEALVHRPFRTWVDLAERLGLRLHTPRPAAAAGRVVLTFTKLGPEPGWARGDGDDPTERYGAGSGYQRISKAEDPGFVLDLADALERVGLPAAPRVLDLGVNTGDELALMMELRPELRAATFVGVDHSASALRVAAERLGDARHRFVRADLGALPQLDLGERFDLVLSIGTLHSPGVDDRAVLRHVVQERLRARGGVVIGVPNCSYRDGEVVHGAKMKNFSQPDLSLLVKSVAFYRRYLHQHRRKVYVTGKHYVLVTGVAGSAEAKGGEGEGVG